MGRDRCLAWELEHVPCTIDASQLSSTLVDQVLHHLVQEEHLGPTVAELEDPRQKQLAPETRGGPASCLEPVQEVPETPVLERREVSPASAPAEPEDVPAVASAQGPGPELEPHEPAGLGPRALGGMAPGVAEPGPGPEPTSPCAASPWDIPGVVSGRELEPRESSGAGPMAPAGMAQCLAEPEVVPEPTSPCAMSTPDLPRKRKRGILVFAPRLVAEQLTLMCAELYSRVECGECKVYVERQPLREAIALLAPNILNVIKHFGTTFHLVISSCLGGPSTTTQDRARVVEFWIQVAKECLALRNFESFRAIIFALQRPPVRRLESTWGQVSWKSSWIYRKLKKRNKGLKGKQLLKEARAMVRQWPQSPRASQDTKQQGMIPPLGLILYDALEKQQEHHVDITDFLEEILTYKFLARQYDLEPKEHFLSFFRTVKLLREDQR
ncbi:ral-GDS-related protein-like [Manis javanica]|uniref:ral-GDS-related protein-like n=1 Tax=Manis javanica TaxID=9974 RepID=UPI003C6CD91C